MQDSVIERVRCTIWNSVFDGRLSERDADAAARAVLSVPGIFIAPDRQPEDSDLGYRGRIYMAFCDWLEPTLYDLSQSLSGTAINEGDA